MKQRLCDACFEIIEVTPPTEPAPTRYEIHGPLNTVRDYHGMCVGKAVDAVMQELYDGTPVTAFTVFKYSTYDA